MTELIGEVTAQAAIAMMMALDERRRGKLSSATRSTGGDLIAALVILRQNFVGDFDATAREFGRRVLIARYSKLKRELSGPVPPLTEATIAELVSHPLHVVNQVVQAQLH